MEYLFVLAAAFALLFLVILISNKSKRKEHWLLALILVLMVISCVYVFNLYHHDGVYYLPFFSELNYAIPLLYGVLLWFYTKSLLLKRFKLSKTHLLHFVPFVGFLFFLFFVDQSVTKKDFGYPMIKIMINPIYIGLTLFELHRFKRNLVEQYSYDDRMHHYWLSWVCYGALVLWLVACAGNVFNYLNDYQTNVLGDYFLIGFLAVFLFILAYVGFNRTQIFQTVDKLSFDKLSLDKDTSKDKINNHAYQELFDHLKWVMDREKPFLNSKLSLHELSRIATIPASKLSLVINSCSGQNFYDFVNGYRVNAVIQKLGNVDMQKYSILGIASDCGFNSKASFNRVFKRITGKTPTEYQKSM